MKSYDEEYFFVLFHRGEYFGRQVVSGLRGVGLFTIFSLIGFGFVGLLGFLLSFLFAVRTNFGIIGQGVYLKYSIQSTRLETIK